MSVCVCVSQCVPYVSGISGSENRSVPKRPKPIMAETDSDVVHCPTVGNKHWMFDPWLSDVIYQFAHFSIWQN